MQKFFESVELGLNHVQVIVRAMYAVATSDGIHDTEMVLLREFYRSCQDEASGLATFEEIVGVAYDDETARDVLDTDELKRVCLHSCLFLAFADGQLTDGERAKVQMIARGLEVEKVTLDELEEQVRDLLLRQIAMIQNVDALREVARELKPT